MAGPGTGISLLDLLIRPRRVRPAPVFAIGLSAVALALALLIAGVDPGAMKMLLGGLLFGLIFYAAYLGDTVGGRVSLRRGYLVGGLTTLAVFSWFSCKNNYEKKGTPLPDSLNGVLAMGIGLLLFAPIGAVVGAMIGVIGGRVLRVVGSLVRGPSAAKAGPTAEKTAKEDFLEWEEEGR